MEKLINPKELAKQVDLAVWALMIMNKEFDSIAFRSMSGALLAPPVAAILGKSLIMVRKEENSHSSHKVEGDIFAKTYIIVDDFTSSGKTARTIVEEIKIFAPQAKCLGLLAVDKLREKFIKDAHLETWWMTIK